MEYTKAIKPAIEQVRNEAEEEYSSEKDQLIQQIQNENDKYPIQIRPKGTTQEDIVLRTAWDKLHDMNGYRTQLYLDSIERTLMSKPKSQSLTNNEETWIKLNPDQTIRTIMFQYCP